MLVSLQADYALRVLVDVATYQARGRAVVTREIADRQRVPRVFLTKIVAQLASHGMLRTQRGKGGGVTLGKKPEDIVLLDVIETFEGSLQFNQCAHDANCCSLAQGCSIRAFWRHAEVHLKDFFRARTLSDLLELMTHPLAYGELPDSLEQPKEMRSVSVGNSGAQ
ncbi:Rrf2 family transcriptional regulator [bacterium]|nr:Rrf2 family transcriptional regulator [bacterium]MBU1984127.1 Rrf2 family transcriptional regulator [bacterium]